MANSLNTIVVDGVTYDAAQYASTHKADTAAKNELGKDAFLQLLVAQLQYQDPLEPQDNSEFVAEMAQFTSVEQLSNMAENLKNMESLITNIDTSVLVGQLSGMIGKSVDWSEAVSEYDEQGNLFNSTKDYAGVITGVTVADGTTKVIATTESGEMHEIEISDITNVYDLEKTVEKLSGGAVGEA